jgi:hypothetical protein
MDAPVTRHKYWVVHLTAVEQGWFLVAAMLIGYSLGASHPTHSERLDVAPATCRNRTARGILRRPAA